MIIAIIFLQGSHILTVQYIETMRSGVLWAVVSSKSSVRGALFFFIERADFLRHTRALELGKTGERLWE